MNSAEFVECNYCDGRGTVKASSLFIDGEEILDHHDICLMCGGSGKLRTMVKTITLRKLNLGDKIIQTKDWGDFKIRKNGRYRLRIGNEIVRVSKINREVYK